MPAGTITLTNNSTAVTGSGTAFATELKANDFLVAVVGGVTYTLGVKSVESATALTLTTAYGGPTTTGLAWTPVPNGVLVGITAQIAADTARAIRGLNYDKQNWQQVYSASGNITVMLPDGSTYTGPAWGGIATSLGNKASKGANSDITSLSGLTTALSIGQGGTGAQNWLGACKQLNTAAGNVALGVPGDANIYGHFLTNPNGGYYSSGSSPAGVPGGAGWYMYNLHVHAKDSQEMLQYGAVRVVDSAGAAYIAIVQSGVFGPWKKDWNQVNTTVDAGGFIKVASPIIKIFANGTAENNDESEGATVERVGVGQYLITGILGMNSDAVWGGTDGGFDIPKDRNRQPLIWLDYEVNPDGSVLVKTYHRTHPDAPSFARNLIGVKDDAGNLTETVKNGDPIDIPSDQFVSVRVEMPKDSIYNQKQEKDMQAAELVRQKMQDESEQLAS